MHTQCTSPLIALHQADIVKRYWGGGVNEVWLLQEFGFRRRIWRDQVRMANDEEIYLVGRDTVELRLLRAGCSCTGAANSHQ
jgi:hypothetical protein